VLYLAAHETGRLVFTNRALAADVYWIRAIQYFGGHTQQAQAQQADPVRRLNEPRVSFDLLYPLLDITTTLDPQFNIAYRFGAIFLSESYPHGPNRPDLAVTLLEKGLRASPEKWQYWQDIGFVYYWSVHDYAKASEAFRRGAEVPGAPWWMKSLAATMLVKGGDRATSRLLEQLQAIDEIERLQAALDRGTLRRLPNDPSGTPYRILGSRVDLSPDSPLQPLPVEPGSHP
jgi:hypothetical protein